LQQNFWKRLADVLVVPTRPHVALVVLTTIAMAATAVDSLADGRMNRLVNAYPEYLLRAEGNELVWRDGTRMQIDDGQGPKSFEQWLAAPDLKDMLAIAYPAGTLLAAPRPLQDPGRARNAAFFAKMYGDCAKGDVQRDLVEVVWLPNKLGQKLLVTKINGVSERLKAISLELDALSSEVDVYLKPSEGTFVCRPIAGTNQLSAHGYGIAIDIATKHADYWRWRTGGTAAYRNRIPQVIVDVFERHGFIWGGKWWHYDTMHFEYRPELAPISTR
jgi:D-alanyl-D-alanine carboxypeptidase